MEEPEALKDEARKLALKNVTDNAKLYAEAAGVGLGQILSITEEDSSYQPRLCADGDPHGIPPRRCRSRPARRRSRCASG